MMKALIFVVILAVCLATAWLNRSSCFPWFRTWQRRNGVARKDPVTGEWSYVRQRRHLNGDITLILSHNLLLEDIRNALPLWGRYYKKDEGYFIEAVDKGSNKVKLCGPHSLPSLTKFCIDTKTLKRILRKKPGHVVLGRSFRGWLLVDTEEKVLNACFGRPGGGKSVAAANIIESLSVSEPSAKVAVYDASGVDFGDYEGEVQRILSLKGLVEYLKLVRDECEARRNLFQSPDFTRKGISSIRKYEKLTGKRLPRFHILLDECQRYLSRSIDKNDPDYSHMREIQSLVSQLASEYRKFGLVIWIFGIESKAGELSVPFNSIFIRMSSHLAFPETSIALFGSPIACRPGLNQGRMVVSVDHNPTIVQLPLPRRKDS